VLPNKILRMDLNEFELLTMVAAAGIEAENEAMRKARSE
jgi:hypothetical protein